MRPFLPHILPTVVLSTLDGFGSHLITDSSPNQTKSPVQDSVLRSQINIQTSVQHKVKMGEGRRVLLLTNGLTLSKAFNCVGHQFHHLSKVEMILTSLPGLLC